jgi:hypothetical protein
MRALFLGGIWTLVGAAALARALAIVVDADCSFRIGVRSMRTPAWSVDATGRAL